MTPQPPTALLIIDVQKGLFEKSIPIYNADGLLDNINRLIARAHTANVPVFYIQHASDKILPEGSDGWQLHPRLQQPGAADCVVHKHHASALEKTTLGQELEARHIRRLVVTGLVTHGCVQATCIDTSQHGYEVILVEDGHSNYHKKAKDMIAEWNQKLSQGIVTLKAAEAVDFDA